MTVGDLELLQVIDLDKDSVHFTSLNDETLEYTEHLEVSRDAVFYCFPNEGSETLTVGNVSWQNDGTLKFIFKPKYLEKKPLIKRAFPEPITSTHNDLCFFEAVIVEKMLNVDIDCFN